LSAVCFRVWTAVRECLVIGFLGQFGVVFQGLGFGQVGDGFGDLRIPFCGNFEAFELTEL